MNRFFLGSCQKIFCYSKEIKNFPLKYQKKIEIINPLVREKIYKLNRTFSEDNKFNILVVGGSQGANVFDKSLKKKIVNISKKFQIRVIHQTNKRNISHLKEYYQKNSLCLNMLLKVQPKEAIILSR